MSANQRIKTGCIAAALASAFGMVAQQVAQAQQAPSAHSMQHAHAEPMQPMSAMATGSSGSAPAALASTETSPSGAGSTNAAASGLTGASASASTSSASHPDKRGKSTTVRGELEGKVVQIDAVAGSMLARGDDGIERHFVLDTQARDTAAKFKPGDRIKVLFDRSIRVELKSEGEHAKPGMADNGFDATVVTVNKPARMVSIKGPKGAVFDINVEKTETLDKIKAGSVIHVEMGRPVALSVTPA